jgi:hypothetical protein
VVGDSKVELLLLLPLDLYGLSVQKTSALGVDSSKAESIMAKGCSVSDVVEEVVDGVFLINGTSQDAIMSKGEVDTLVRSANEENEMKEDEFEG